MQYVKSDFAPGTKLTITGHPMKNGQPASWIQAVRGDGVEFNPRLRPSNDAPAPTSDNTTSPSATNAGPSR